MQLKSATKAKATKATAAAIVTAPDTAAIADMPAAIAPVAPVESAPVAVAPVADSKPTAADKRAAYIADYAQAKAVYAILNPGSASCPVKPANGFKAKALNPKAYALSARGAASLYLAILCSGLPLSDGTTYPRRYTMRGGAYIAENGCLSDFDGTAYSVDTTPGIGYETFTLRTGAKAAIESLLGQAKLAAVASLLSPAPVS